MQPLRHFLLALQFFTRVPVTGRLAHWVGYSPAMLRASAAHFPGVGWLVGAATAACLGALLLLLPDTPLRPLVAALLSTALGVGMTGAFHEDGLADVADGLGGSPERERALAIMKDSRIGAFGAIALVLALGNKVALVALLASVDTRLACAGLFLAHVWSRFFPLLLVRGLPHVGDTGGSKSKPLADHIRPAALLVALAWALAALTLVAWQAPAVPWIPALVAAAGTTALLARWFARRLQGFTGDCLGATQQLCELACYLGMSLAVGR